MSIPLVIWVIKLGVRQEGSYNVVLPTPQLVYMQHVTSVLLQSAWLWWILGNSMFILYFFLFQLIQHCYMELFMVSKREWWSLFFPSSLYLTHYPKRSFTFLLFNKSLIKVLHPLPQFQSKLFVSVFHHVKAMVFPSCLEVISFWRISRLFVFRYWCQGVLGEELTLNRSLYCISFSGYFFFIFGQLFG